MIMDVSEVSWSGWKTVGVLGRGSFGAVYEIQRDMLGDTEKAALKVISIPRSENEIQELYNDGYDDESITDTYQEQLKSIVSEYSMMRRLNDCANVVHCDDVHYEKKTEGFGWDIYIKMELLTPLAQALPEDISEKTVIQVGKDICRALILCAKNNIVHRDIKPQNIFVSPNGAYKLGDFGVAKTVERTMGGTIIGTFKYMAPEVYRGLPYGAAADIYSLGLVLYWMLNHRRMPFMPLPPAKVLAGMDGDAANRRLLGDPIPAPANGSEGLKKIVLKACAYDAKDRYKSAEEMLAALENVGRNPDVNVQPAPATDSKRIENPEKTVQVRPAQTDSDITTLVRQPPANNPPEKEKVSNPAPKQPKKRGGVIIFVVLLLLGLAIGVTGILLLLNSDNESSQNDKNSSRTSEHTNNLDSKDNFGSDDSNDLYGNVEIGDTITFGSYEQDNILSNGMEAIEWEVLDVKDGKALLISKYVLDCQPYNSEVQDVTWATCTLRAWLNDEFVNAAFTSDERARIPKVTVMADETSHYVNNQGDYTVDQVFLLSVYEAKQYFGTDDERVCNPTAYAKAQGCKAYNDTSGNYHDSCWWWLRSPGSAKGGATNVGIDGLVHDDVGAYVNSDHYGNRPALWIDLNS